MAAELVGPLMALTGILIGVIAFERIGALEKRVRKLEKSLETK